MFRLLDSFRRRFATRLFLSAISWVLVVRIGLSFSTLEALRQRFLSDELSEFNEEIEMLSITQAVVRASRFVPQATCLTQALAAQIMLAQVGIGSNLVLGVIKKESDLLEAHSWLEANGRVLVGGPVAMIRKFNRLAEFGPYTN